MSRTPDHFDLRHVDPRTLLLEKQVRHDAVVDAELVESVRTLGVLQIITVEERERGKLTVLNGHRRTLAAIEAGLELVPVTVLPLRADIERALAQLAENDHRAGLSDVDHAQAYQQLALWGMSAADIAEMSSTSPERVEAGLRVARSARALDVLAASPEVSLVDLAAAEEFADDPAVYDELIKSATDRTAFAYDLKRAQENRAKAEARAAKVAEVEATGRVVIDWPIGQYDGSATSATLGYLRGVGEKSHEACPGRAVAVQARWGWRAGEPLLIVETAEACADWRAHGHTHSGVRKTTAKAADLPDAEREKRAAERREVVACNKAWPTATAVRRDWINAYLAARVEKRTDRTTVTWVTDWLLAAPHGAELGRFLAEWMGVETGWRSKPLVDASLARLDMIQLGHALAGAESFLGIKDGWRSDLGRDKKHRTLASYLKLLEHLGYVLSPVEQLAAGYRLRKGESL
jgi:ParB family chromosome partitioning protein